VTVPLRRGRQPASGLGLSSIISHYEEKRKIILANATLAALFCLELIKVDLNRADPKKFGRFIYHLMYRSLDDRALFGWLESLQEVSVRTRKATYNVFVASPGDCSKLRKATEEVLVEVNRHFPGELKLNSYFWELDKTPGITADYQGEVFEEAERKWGSKGCDILVCFVWHKFGEKTVEEFDKYAAPMIGDSDRTLLFCRYNGTVKVGKGGVDAGSLKKLDDWISGIEQKIAPLGRERGAIATVPTFKEELRFALLQYLKRQEAVSPSAIDGID
jgi:hypothetical protein